MCFNTRVCVCVCDSSPSSALIGSHMGLTVDIIQHVDVQRKLANYRLTGKPTSTSFRHILQLGWMGVAYLMMKKGVPIIAAVADALSCHKFQLVCQCACVIVLCCACVCVVCAFTLVLCCAVCVVLLSCCVCVVLCCVCLLVCWFVFVCCAVVVLACVVFCVVVLVRGACMGCVCVVVCGVVLMCGCANVVVVHVWAYACVGVCMCGCVLWFDAYVCVLLCSFCVSVVKVLTLLKQSDAASIRATDKVTQFTEQSQSSQYKTHTIVDRQAG